MTRVPHSYDEISRHTVVQPDGSWRPEPPPTEDEVRLDRHIREAIREALLGHGIETIGFEVIRGRVILRGWLHDAEDSALVEKIIRAAVPDVEIDNRVRIGTG